MKTKEAIDFYGSKNALSRELGIPRQNITMWGIYPVLEWQLMIEKKTKKALLAETPEFMIEYKRKKRRKAKAK